MKRDTRRPMIPRGRRPKVKRLTNARGVVAIELSADKLYILCGMGNIGSGAMEDLIAFFRDLSGRGPRVIMVPDEIDVLLLDKVYRDRIRREFDRQDMIEAGGIPLPGEYP